MKKAKIAILIILVPLLISGVAGAAIAVSNETTSIGGQVTNLRGKPLSGALVVANSNFGEEYTISDDSGNYVLNDIPIFENVKISCVKEFYKTFQTTVFIDMVGICLHLDIKLHRIFNIVTQNFVVNINMQNMMKIYNL